MRHLVTGEGFTYVLVPIVRTVSTEILKSDNDAATAVVPYTTACSPKIIALPGAVATDLFIVKQY